MDSTIKVNDRIFNLSGVNVFEEGYENPSTLEWVINDGFIFTFNNV